MRHLNVLIACEESQSECIAFRELGHKAYSCDIQPCKRGGHPEWHIKGDVRPYLNGVCQFYTQDRKHHHISRWHLIIAHPPCTYLCKVGSIHMVKDGVLVQERYQKMIEARQFFYECLNAKAPFVAVENPLPMARTELPQPDCFVHPYWYGHPFSKKTLYWLRNLPPLMPDSEMAVRKEFVRSSRGKYRSRTFNGIARAIAKQWGSFVVNELGIKLKEIKE